MASRMPLWVASRMPFWVAFWRLFRTAFWVPFWVPSPEGSFLEANRTPGACFLHRMLPMMHRVPQEAFLSTARIFGTIGGPLRNRMPDTEAGCRHSGAWRTF